MDYDKDYELFEKWFSENELRFHHAQMDDKQIAYSAWLASREAAQHGVQADELSGHANNCVLRSGGYACTCGAAETTRR